MADQLMRDRGCTCWWVRCHCGDPTCRQGDAHIVYKDSACKVHGIRVYQAADSASGED